MKMQILSFLMLIGLSNAIVASDSHGAGRPEWHIKPVRHSASSVNLGVPNAKGSEETLQDWAARKDALKSFIKQQQSLKPAFNIEEARLKLAAFREEQRHLQARTISSEERALLDQMPDRLVPLSSSPINSSELS